MGRYCAARRRPGVLVFGVAASLLAALAEANAPAWAEEEDLEQPMDEFQQPMDDIEQPQQPQQQHRVCCRIGQGNPHWSTAGQCSEVGGNFINDRACRRRKGLPPGVRRFGERFIRELLRRQDRDKPRATYGDVYPSDSVPFWQPIDYVKPRERLTGPRGRRGSQLSRDEAVSAFARIIPDYLEAGTELRTNQALAAKIGGALGPSGRESAPETEKWAVSFPLTYEGIPIARFTRVLALALPDGEIQWIRARNVPYDVDHLRPTVRRGQAKSFVQRSLFRRLNRGDRRRMRMTEAKLEIFTGNDGLGRLSWAFVVRVDRRAVPIVRKYWISAVDRPRVLYSESLIFHSVSGRVTGNVWKIGSNEKTATVSLPYVTVHGAGSKTTSDAKGRFRLKADDPQIRATLRGRFSEVTDMAGAPLRASASAGSGTANLHFNSANEAQTAQISAYYWTAKMLEFFAPILDAKAKQLAYVKVYVNQGGSPCDAYYDYIGIDAGTLHYFRSGRNAKAPYWRRGKVRTTRSNCGNTALASIIGHEMGHALHHAFGTARGFNNIRLSEAFGDAIAVLAFRTPCIGPGLVAGQCMRYATDKVSWNSVRKVRNDPYAATSVLSGFAWELVRQLERKYGDRARAFEVAGDLILGTVKLDPPSIPSVVCAILEVDDDDTVKENGSPHFKQIVAAAKSRGFPFPSTPRRREDECPLVRTM